MHSYEVRPRKYGADLISEQLPFGKLRYGGTNAVENAVDYARFFSKAHPTEVKVYDTAGTVIETHQWDARTGTDLIV